MIEKNYTNLSPITRHEQLYNIGEESDSFIRSLIGDSGLWGYCCIEDIDAENIPQDIITYYLKNYHHKCIDEIYVFRQLSSFPFDRNAKWRTNDKNYNFYLGIPYILFVDGFEKYFDPLKSHRSYEQIEEARNKFQKYLCDLRITFENSLRELVESRMSLYNSYKTGNSTDVSTYFETILMDSFYSFVFDCNPTVEFHADSRVLIVNYNYPLKEETPHSFLKVYEKKPDEWKTYSESKFNKIYDEILAAITIRSIAELFQFDYDSYIDSICFNGCITRPNSATGIVEESCILSVNVSRTVFESYNLEYLNPIDALHSLKAVKSKKLCDGVPVVPILRLSKTDKRFVEPKQVETSQFTNLAEMNWEDFEHLVRQIFEWEFSEEGSEIHITQASRDGGVDAIVFDPDPIRGGKIVIQAKRYTNTVGVSAVRDLYGTIINEGANKGILITTSDYGSDSYKFAQGKPITLLNGGHLLYLLEKHGRKARINIDEAKRKFHNLS